MSVSKWRYTEECNGRPCPGDCDHCSFEPTDLINRADAIEAVTKLCVDGYIAKVDGYFIPLTDALINTLSALPSADCIEFDFNKYQPRVRNKVNDGTPSAEAVQGEWVDVENEPYCECSVCGSYIDNLDDDYAFCPRCGAKMKGGDTE